MLAAVMYGDTHKVSYGAKAGFIDCKLKSRLPSVKPVADGLFILAPYAENGFSSGTCSVAKSRVLRVTSVRPWRMAQAAMSASL